MEMIAKYWNFVNYLQDFTRWFLTPVKSGLYHVSVNGTALFLPAEDIEEATSLQLYLFLFVLMCWWCWLLFYITVLILVKKSSDSKNIRDANLLKDKQANGAFCSL